ncbi:amidohydrolase family protein [Candidatus Sumerlaeota bacterium]|nr:amidohydrolase family protein [Candidatus Sumerlaeota bacterium]
MSATARFTARRVLLPGGEWLENGVVEARDGVITDVRPRGVFEGCENLQEWPDCAILPGFINAHCHLEYSAMHGLLQPAAFTDWLFQIVRLKSELSEETLRAALPGAIEQIIRSGTTTLVDNLSLDITQEALLQSGLDAYYLFELIESRPEDWPAQMAEEALARRMRGYPLNKAGFAPHAPYSIHVDLFRSAAERALEYRWPLSIHVSETLEENEFFLKGGGPFYELKRRFASLPSDWSVPGCSPLQHLDAHGLLDFKPLIVHANCPEPGDAVLLGRNGLSVVFCPGTHRYFNRAPWPMTAYRQAGVNVCIGTDSLASNESLDLTRELQLTHELHPDLSSEELLAMITESPAAALNFPDKGRIHSGCRADFSIWRWPYANLMEWIEDAQRQCLAVFAAGRSIACNALF